MSDWATVQETNGQLNNERRKIKFRMEYIRNAKQACLSLSDDTTEIQAACDCFLAAFQAEYDALGGAYLSSGFQYDDDDPRNIMAERFDVEFSDAAKTGSNRRDEIESEIRRNVIAKYNARTIEEAMGYFGEDMALYLGLDQTLAEAYNEWIDIQNEIASDMEMDWQD